MPSVRFDLDTLEGIDGFLSLFDGSENDWAEQLNCLTFAGFPKSRPKPIQLRHIGAVMARADVTKLHLEKLVLLLRGCSSYKDSVPGWRKFRDKLWVALENNPKRSRIMIGLM